MTAAIRALDPGGRRLVAALDLLRIGGNDVGPPRNGTAGSAPPRAPIQRI